jgi:hypothetical protein
MGTLYNGRQLKLWKEDEMPRANGSNNRDKSLEEWYPAEKVIGEVVIRILEMGAYVGLYHNYANGINASIMYENDRERFYASNTDELKELPKEVKAWIDEKKREQDARKKGNRQKGS